MSLKPAQNLDLPLVHVSTDHLFSGEAPLVDEGHPVAQEMCMVGPKTEAEIRVLPISYTGSGDAQRIFMVGPKLSSFVPVIWSLTRFVQARKWSCLRTCSIRRFLIETAAQAVHELIKLKASGIFHVVGDETHLKVRIWDEYCGGVPPDKSLIQPGFLIDQVSLVPRPHDMSLSNRKTCALLGRKTRRSRRTSRRTSSAGNKWACPGMHNL